MAEPSYFLLVKGTWFNLWTFYMWKFYWWDMNFWTRTLCSDFLSRHFIYLHNWIPHSSNSIYAWFFYGTTVLTVSPKVVEVFLAPKLDPAISYLRGLSNSSLCELYFFFRNHLLHDHGIECHSLSLSQHSRYFFQLHRLYHLVGTESKMYYKDVCLFVHKLCYSLTSVWRCDAYLSRDNGEWEAAENGWDCGWEQGCTLAAGLTFGAGAI